MKLKMNFVTNPFYAYITVFIFVLILYSFPFSNLFPPLREKLLFFFILSFIISFTIGKCTRHCFSFISIKKDSRNNLIFKILLAGISLDFIYCRQVPLLNMIFGIGSYQDFIGIPFFHVLILYSTCTFTIYFFHQIISSESKGLKIKFIILLFSMIVYVNRGAFLITLVACFTMYLLYLKSLNLNRILYVVIGVVVIFYLFGKMGNIRQEASREDETYILKLGGATDEYINSGIPYEFYWGYLYAISPIGNFQNIMDSDVKRDDSSSLRLLMQFLPEFLSNRLSSLFALAPDNSDYLAKSVFNAPCAFYRPYNYGGMLGVWMMFFFTWVIYSSFTWIVKRSSKYYLTGISIISSCTIFSTFSNMWYVSGLTMLALIVFLSIVERITIKSK